MEWGEGGSTRMNEYGHPTSKELVLALIWSVTAKKGEGQKQSHPATVLVILLPFPPVAANLWVVQEFKGNTMHNNAYLSHVSSVLDPTHLSWISLFGHAIIQLSFVCHYSHFSYYCRASAIGAAGAAMAAPLFSARMLITALLMFIATGLPEEGSTHTNK